METIKVTIPGSKSLTNRAIVLATLSNGVSKISNFSNSVDSQIMIKAIKKLGVNIIESKKELQIIGNGGKFREFNGVINTGEAGTATRFLTAIKELVPGNMLIKVSKGMKERPMQELVESLNNIQTGKISIRGNISSQFISSLLMISPILKKGLIIHIVGTLVSRSYVDMTIDLMKKFGVIIINKQYREFIVEKNQQYKLIDYEVEGDASGASYFFGIAAVTGKKIRVNIDPNSVQGDVKFADILEKMGCKVEKNIREKWIEVEGPRVLNSINTDMSLMPDTAQTLAVIASFAKGISKITGLTTLKVKETDRLLALKNELRKINIKSEITKDSITVVGGNPKEAVIETYGDHRMAMAFAVAKARIPNLIIKNPEVVKKSFPDFWEKFKQI